MTEHCPIAELGRSSRTPISALSLKRSQQACRFLTVLRSMSRAAFGWEMPSEMPLFVSRRVGRSSTGLLLATVSQSSPLHWAARIVELFTCAVLSRTGKATLQRAVLRAYSRSVFPSPERRNVLGLVKQAAGPGNLMLTECPVPLPAPGQVSVEVHGTGVCGTDLHIEAGEYPTAVPVILGHEVAGVVCSVGLGVDESYMVAAGREVGLGYFDHPPVAWWLW